MFKSGLFSQAAVYTASNFSVAAIPFLLLPLLTRSLDPEAYGLIAMFQMVVSFFAMLVGLNVQGAIMVRFFNRESFNIPTYISTTLCILVLTTISVLFLVAVFALYLETVTSLPLFWLVIATLVAFLQFLVLVTLTLWQSSKKPIRYGVLRVFQAFADAFGSVTLVVTFLLSWQGRLTAMAGAWLCSAAIATFFLIKEGWVAKSVSLVSAQDALRFGVPLLPHAIGGLLISMVDRYMVTNLIGISSMGVYMVAAQIGLVIGITADSVNRAFAPWLMEALVNIEHDQKAQIVRYTYLYFIAMVALVLLITSCLPLLLPLLVGDDFQGAMPFVFYMLAGNAFTGMYYMVTNYIFYTRRTELLSALTISVGLVSVGLSFLLTDAYGVKGAAIGFMVGQFLLFFGAWILSHISYPMPWLTAFFGSASAK